MNRLHLLILLMVICCWEAISAQPVADFSANTVKGCVPLIVNFSDASTGSPSTWYWEFGNGNTSTLQNPGAIYAVPGKYTVKLTASNAGGSDVITKTAYIEVFANPSAAFTVSAASGCVPHTVQFTDISTPGTGAINNWLWDFGDGSISTLQNPTHIYTNSGSYTVSLIVTDVNGCKHQKQTLGAVTVNRKPGPSFTVSDPGGCGTPHTVTFSNTTPSGSLSFAWDFGDGNSSTATSPTHTYTSAGTYHVRLISTNTATGCKDTAYVPQAVTIAPLQVDFKPKTAINGCIDEDIQFDPDVKPFSAAYNYSWDFGDGASSTALRPLHAYKNAGTYTVKLVVRKGTVCLDSMVKTNHITILNKPKASFTVSDSLLCRVGSYVQFTATDINAVKWEWNFGDSTFSTQQAPLKSYNEQGDFDVRLVVWNSNNCPDTLVYPNRISLHQTYPLFEKTDSTGCEPHTVTFTAKDSSYFPVTDYEWVFGDGTRAKGKIVTHTYDSGSYVPYLVTTNSIGCRDSFLTHHIWVGKPVPPDFEAHPTTVCNREIVDFTNLTDSNYKNDISIEWVFPDGSAETWDAQHAFHLEPGTYDITLRTWQNGCLDTITKFNYITILSPYAEIKSDFTPCSNDSGRIFDVSSSGHLINWYLGNKDTIRNVREIKVDRNAVFFPIILEAIDTITHCTDRDTLNGWPTAFLQTYFDIVPGPRCAPASVSITNLSINAETYAWDFGNGQQDFSENPSPILYTKPGTYTIKLTNTHADGCQKTFTRLVVITGDSLSMDVSPKSGCLPLTLQLKNTSPGDISNMYWEIGDGIIIPANTTLANYTRTTPMDVVGDSLKIKLLKMGGPGCVTADSTYVLPSGPKSYFEFSAFKTCTGTRVVFRREMGVNPGVGKVRSYFTFHDGTIDSSSFPVRFYYTEGKFPVRLTAIDSLGCSYTFTDSVPIAPLSFKAGLSAAPTNSTCPPLLVHFKDSSFAKNTYIASRLWYFGDGATSTLKDPSHLYLLAGRFTVSLVVTDSAGCKDSLSMPELVVIDGPTGQYQFDKKTGCTPLAVNFTSQTQRAVKIQWDLGDGKLPYGNNVSNVYTDTGMFIPLLTLEDSFGCTYTLPPVDTIWVYASPKGSISYDGRCALEPFKFYNNVQPGSGYISSYEWDFGDGSALDTGSAPLHIYAQSGSYLCQLTVTNSKGCRQTFQIPVKVYGFAPQVKISKNRICMGESSQLSNTSLSDTTLLLTEWWIGNQGPFTGNTIQPVFPNKGKHSIKMRLTNVLGCRDSILLPDTVLVGDTIPPQPPALHRVTVDDHQHVRIEWAPDTTLDFDRFELYRMDNPALPQLIYSSTNRLDTSFTETILTLYQSHRYLLKVQNFCGAVSATELSRSHATVELLAQPAVNAVNLRWNHYVGWDSVYQYEIYRENIYQTGQFDLIGKVNGTDSLFTDSLVICDAHFFYRVKAWKDAAQSRISWSDTSGAAPIYIPEVLPPPMKRVSVEEDRYVIVEWYDDSGNRFPLLQQFVERNTALQPYEQVGKPMDGNTFSLEDKRVKVDDHSYRYRIYGMDSCEDLSPKSAYSKTILLQADTSFEERPFVEWTAYEGWPEGVHHYTVALAEPNGQFIPLADLSPTDSQFVDYQTNLNQRADYCYRVTAFRNPSVLHPGEVWSHSNIDCAPVRSRIFVPNAFTVNKDGINENFQIKGMYIREYEIQIFNRWGEKVFVSTDINHSWDGSFRGSYAQMDAYIWVVRAIGVDGATYLMSGTVTLVR